MCYKVGSSSRLVFLVLFIIGYLVLGSIIFSVIEGPREKQLREELQIARTKFLLQHTCLADAELEEFIKEIVTANNRGVSAVGNVSSEPNWSFGQSLFFAGTVLTTIGYGHVTPLSEGGKVFCIVYALIGIPLTLIMFTALVERLMLLTAKLLTKLMESFGHLYKTFHIRLIHLTILFSVLIIFFFIVPAAIFAVLEHDWNFLDAFYYCFISLTTIGLGDYIPGDKPQQAQRVLYKICITCYLFLGLIMMMLVLANIYDVPELNVGFHFYMRSDDEEQERLRLRSADNQSGPKYTQHVDDPQNMSQSATSVSRGDDDEQQLTQAQQ